MHSYFRAESIDSNVRQVCSNVGSIGGAHCALTCTVPPRRDRGKDRAAAQGAIRAGLLHHGGTPQGLPGLTGGC